MLGKRKPVEAVGVPTTRRNLLTGGIGLIAGLLARPAAARAATGDPLILGEDNRFRGTTRLTSRDTHTALVIEGSIDDPVVEIMNTNGGGGGTGMTVAGAGVGLVCGTTEGGRGLEVFDDAVFHGRTFFERSGTATIPQGDDSVTFPADVEESSRVIATLQGPGGILQGVRVRTGELTIRLRNEASEHIEVAWLVVGA